MGCSSCGSGAPSGCGSNGNCGTGGCNKMNTYDWISVMDIYDPTEFDVVEVSFKKGAQKGFYTNQSSTEAITGDMVVVSSNSGYDVGRITLSGELVRAQMKKKRAHEDRVEHNVVRRANNRDIEKLNEARSLEKETLIRARVITRTLGLKMKIGDIQCQGDKRKATIYYTAEGRIDFRELVKSFVHEFKVKIEMRQIGARQESARIGGIGSCGRELCCSTWMSDFKTVTTSAARYQNIAINQAKLSGQCGRLKCCLNYELDTYMDALKDFPKRADYLKTKKGKAALIKTDIFKGLMFYTYIDVPTRLPIVSIDKERVKEIQALNKQGEMPEELIDHTAILAQKENEPDVVDFSDVDEIELPMEKKKPRKNRNKRRKNSGNSARRSDSSKSSSRNKKRRNPQNKNDNRQGGNQKSDQNRSSQKD